MTLHRFFVPPDAIAGERADLPDEATRQIAQVLRLRAGERVVLVSGGMEHEAELAHVSRAGVTARVVASRPVGGEPRLRLTLCPALLKADKFEWVVQKCTELGVAAFQPVISARCVSDAVSAQKLERWQRIAQEAAEQSGRGAVPAVAAPVALDALSMGGALPALFAYEAEGGMPLREALDHLAGRDAFALVIGPEGGFAREEFLHSIARGAIAVSLGPRILRAETASIAAVAAIMHQRGEFDPSSSTKQHA